MKKLSQKKKDLDLRRRSRACNLCGSARLNLVRGELRDISGYRVCKCMNCEHVQVQPMPSTTFLEDFYSSNLQDKNRGKEINYQKLKNNSAFDTRRHVELTKKYVKQKTTPIIDIGSGYGFFIENLKEAGYSNVAGHEIGAERRKIPQERGHDVFNFDMKTYNGKHGLFKVVTLFHVLEHTTKPISFLEDLKKIMADDGLLICEVPNANELLLKTCPPYNDFYWIIAHLNYFTRRTLTRVFADAGYEIMDIVFQQRYGLSNLFNWLFNGKPQIETPVFEIMDEYKDLERYYRNSLEKSEQSDAIIVIAKVRQGI